MKRGFCQVQERVTCREWALASDPKVEWAFTTCQLCRHGHVSQFPLYKMGMVMIIDTPHRMIVRIMQSKLLEYSIVHRLNKVVVVPMKNKPGFATQCKDSSRSTIRCQTMARK